MENAGSFRQEQILAPPTEIIVPSGSVNVAVRVALEHGKINNELLINNSEGVELSEEQSSALIEELQSQDIVSKETDTEGNYKKLERKKRDEQARGIAGAVGAVSLHPAVLKMENSKATKAASTFLRHNWYARQVRGFRERVARPDEQDKAKKLAKRNAELAELARLSIEKREKKAAWEQNRRWKLAYEERPEPAQPKTTPVPEIAGDAEIMTSALNGGSLFGSSVETAKLPLGQERVNKQDKRQNRGFTPRDIASLVEQKVISPEEGRALLLGKDVVTIQPAESISDKKVDVATRDDASKRSEKPQPRAGQSSGKPKSKTPLNEGEIKAMQDRSKIEKQFGIEL